MQISDQTSCVYNLRGSRLSVAAVCCNDGEISGRGVSDLYTGMGSYFTDQRNLISVRFQNRTEDEL